MPFTASHPAAVLVGARLLARWGLPIPALVIGSIIPDIFMMVPIPAVVHFAHTPPGLVTADLAAGLLAFRAWQAFFAPALIVLAPRGLRARLPERLTLHFGSWRIFGWWRIAAAVVVGAATHLAWDSFTHDWMWGPRHIPWLAARHGPLLGFQWVQGVSDVVGMAIVAVSVAAWWRRAAVRPDPTVIPLRHRLPAWLAILGPAAVVFSLLLARDSFYVAITTASALGVIGLTAVAWLLRRDQRWSATFCRPGPSGGCDG